MWMTARNVLILLYRAKDSAFMGRELMHDLINVCGTTFWLAAKAKLRGDDHFFLIELGTDNIEAAFRILRASCYSDTFITMPLSTSPYNHDSTKHIDLRRHFLRETVESGAIDLKHIPGKLNVADFFTKAVPRVDIKRLRHEVGMSRIPLQG